jgi:hypothetical protein
MPVGQPVQGATAGPIGSIRPTTRWLLPGKHNEPEQEQEMAMIRLGNREAPAHGVV